MTHKRENLRKWLGVLACVAALCLASSLGFWQLGRAADKQALHAAQQSRGAAAPLAAGAVQAALQAAPSNDAAVQQLLHRPVALQGQWLAAHTVYLDNRPMQGRPGFWVFTPLQLASGDVVLVQRGWIARNFQDRLALQPVQTPAGVVTVQGHLAGEPAQLYALGDGAHAMPAPGAPQIYQNLRLADWAQRAGLPLWPVTVVQSGPPSEGVLREWPQPLSGVDKHYGYAFQWFAMAAVLLALLLWFQLWVPLRRARTVRDGVKNNMQESGDPNNVLSP